MTDQFNSQEEAVATLREMLGEIDPEDVAKCVDTDMWMHVDDTVGCTGCGERYSDLTMLNDDLLCNPCVDHAEAEYEHIRELRRDYQASIL